MVWTQESQSFVWFDCPGESSPEKDCCWWHWSMFWQPERKSSSESCELCITAKPTVWFETANNIMAQLTRDKNIVNWRYTIGMTHVVETAVNVTNKSPSRDYPHPDNQTTETT